MQETSIISCYNKTWDKPTLTQVMVQLENSSPTILLSWSLGCNAGKAPSDTAWQRKPAETEQAPTETPGHGVE